MQNIFTHPLVVKVKEYVLRHRILSSVIFIVLCYGGYRIYTSLNDTTGETRYVLGTVSRETIIASISGSGQVSASTQLDIKPKASGDVVYLGVASGQEVKMGTLIAQVDARDAQKTVRDAEVNLSSAKLSLEKLQKPADELSITQSENTLLRARESKETANNNLASTYEDGFNTVANVFLDLPTVMTGLQDVLFTSSQALDSNSQNIDYYTTIIYRYDDIASKNYHDDAYNKYQKARISYDKAFANYKTTNRLSATSTIEALIIESYEATKDVAEAVKSANNLIQLSRDKLIAHNLKSATLSDTHLTNLNTYTKSTNTYLTNLLSAGNTIKSNKDAILNADRSITENTQSLAKLRAGTDTLDLESAQLSVKQRENALLDAREKLADYYIRAPFDGTVAKLNSKKGDAVTSGTALATFITKQKIAEVSLNEVDAAKIKVGQKVTLTFDAVDGLNITGQVSEVDTVGTVSQGVVTYTVKIGFDTQDDRVKSGMSVSAAIITDVKQNVLAVPVGAVKSQGGTSYVDLVADVGATSTNQGVILSTPPQMQIVEIGLSNDTLTEVISGLKEGDHIVIRTIAATTQTASQAPSILGAATGNRNSGGGGNALRALR